MRSAKPSAASRTAKGKCGSPALTAEKKATIARLIRKHGTALHAAKEAASGRCKGDSGQNLLCRSATPHAQSHHPGAITGKRKPTTYLVDMRTPLTDTPSGTPTGHFNRRLLPVGALALACFLLAGAITLGWYIRHSTRKAKLLLFEGVLSAAIAPSGYKVRDRV